MKLASRVSLFLVVLALLASGQVMACPDGPNDLPDGSAYLGAGSSPSVQMVPPPPRHIVAWPQWRQHRLPDLRVLPPPVKHPGPFYRRSR